MPASRDHGQKLQPQNRSCDQRLSRREGSIARAALWQAALVVVPFTGIYGLLDVVFSSDGPVWLLTPIIVGALWLLFSQVVDVEAD